MGSTTRLEEGKVEITIEGIQKGKENREQEGSVWHRGQDGGRISDF